MGLFSLCCQLVVRDTGGYDVMVSMQIVGAVVEPFHVPGSCCLR